MPNAENNLTFKKMHYRLREAKFVTVPYVNFGILLEAAFLQKFETLSNKGMKPTEIC